MREFVRRGNIGKVRHAKLTFRSDSRRCNRPWNWWSTKPGAARWGPFGSHVIDGWRWLLALRSDVFLAILPRTYASER